MIVVERLMPEWLQRVQRDGRWDEPYPWPAPQRLLVPWTDDEMTAAFDTLREIYSPAVTKRVFDKPGSIIASVLRDEALIEHSALLYLGLDAAVAAVWRHPSLVKSLRDDENWMSARYETRMMAAMQRESVEWHYEPLKSERGRNPDFRVRTAERELIIDAKAARVSHHTKTNEEWFWELMRGSPPAQAGQGELIAARLELHQAAAKLDAATRAALISKVREVARRLHAAGVYPSSETIEDLVTVTVDANSGASIRPVYDFRGEASRVVRGLLHNKASQLPADRSGAFFLDLGPYGQRDLLESCVEVGRWMRDEGRDYAHIEHVFLTGIEFHEHNPMFHVIPVSRRRTPSDVVELANSLIRGLNCYIHRLRGYELPLFEPSIVLPGSDEPDFFRRVD